MRFRWTGLLVAIIAAGGLVAYFSQQPSPAPATRQASTTSVPATTTVAEVIAPPPVPRTLFDVLRREQPAIAATQPLGVPVDLADAGRFIVKHPIFLDEAGHLWLTHPDGEPVQTVLKAMAKSATAGDTTHVVREKVDLVFWTNLEGKIAPAVFVESDGGVVIITPTRTLHLPTKRVFAFSRALSTANFIAIPCDDGVSVLHIDKEVTEQFIPLIKSSDPLAQPQVIEGVRGLLAWTPATPDHAGSGVARFLDNAWTMLDEKDWPTSIVQVSPFLDGSVQQLRQAADGKIEIASALLDTPQVDEKQVLALIELLDDLSETVRNKATNDLQRMGPSAWPIFRKVMDDQLPEAKQRLEILLAGSTAPAIGSMTSVDGKLRVVARYNNGGVLLYGDAGVTIPQPGRDDATVSPAWICVRPDRSPELVNGMLTDDLQPGAGQLLPIGGDWFRTDATTGPRRFIGNAMLPMIRSSEKKYWMPIGSDRRGRWLFRAPGDASATLLIDPTIQDVTPRLPVWTIRVKNGEAGWTKDGWPAIKRGGVWALHESGWVALDESDALLTQPAAPSAQPTTGPTTNPSDSMSITEGDGRILYASKEALKVISRGGSEKVWPLPAAATGVDPVTMIETADHKLFLFNQPGRVLMLSAAKGDEPFKIDATFTRNIPNDQPARIWLDPAGRICMAYESSISVLFPSGVIPHEIAVKMSAQDTAANQPE